MRYFFNVRRDGAIIEDLEGLDLANMDAVCKEAAEGARDMIVAGLRSGEMVTGNTAFEVKDENGDTVFIMPFAAVVTKAFRYPAG